MTADTQLTDLRWLMPVANGSGLVCLLGCLIPCARIVWRDQRIRSGILPGWAGLIVWAILVCFLIPWFLSYLTGNRHVWFLFPEMNGIPGVVLMGWIPAGVVSFLVWVVREMFTLLQTKGIRNQESKI
jgi:hypothetical protein